jgi:hypothetical protein
MLFGQLWLKEEHQVSRELAKSVVKNITRGKRIDRVDFVLGNAHQKVGNLAEPSLSVLSAALFFVPSITQLKNIALGNVTEMLANIGARMQKVTSSFMRPTIRMLIRAANIRSTVLSWKNIWNAILNLTKRFITSTATKETTDLKTYNFAPANTARAKCKSALTAVQPTLFQSRSETIASGG